MKCWLHLYVAGTRTLFLYVCLTLPLHKFIVSHDILESVWLGIVKMDLKDWKKIKRSGSYRRQVKKRYEDMMSSSPLSLAATPSRAELKENIRGSVELFLQNFDNDTFDKDFLKCYLPESFSFFSSWYTVQVSEC